MTLINPGQLEVGEFATINVKDKFYGAVHYALVQELGYLIKNAGDSQEAIQEILNRLETLNTKIGQALMKSESYTANRRLLFHSHANRVGDNRYKLWIYDGEPFYEGTCVGSTNADGSLRGLEIYRNGLIENIELWYNDAYHTVTLVHMTDGEGDEWFEFDAGLAIQDQSEILLIRDVIAVEVSVTDEFYAAVANLVGEPLLQLYDRLNNFLDSDMTIEDVIEYLVEAIGDAIDDTNDRVDDAEGNISTNTSNIENHETRISALENSPAPSLPTPTKEGTILQAVAKATGGYEYKEKDVLYNELIE